MKADVKDQWVKDLRSGEFVQGTGFLEQVGSDGVSRLCCLGVLSRQAVKAGAIPAPELRNDKFRYLDDYADHEGHVTGESFNQETCLPRKVAEWAGLFDDEDSPREDVIIIPSGDGSDTVTAIGANDGMGLSFAQIADLIEQNVPGE